MKTETVSFSNPRPRGFKERVENETAY